MKIKKNSRGDTGHYQNENLRFRLVIDGINQGCDTCKHWNQRLFDSDEGWCEMNENNDKFYIDDRHASVDSFVTKKDFICGLFVGKGICK